MSKVNYDCLELSDIHKMIVNGTLTPIIASKSKPVSICYIDQRVALRLERDGLIKVYHDLQGNIQQRIIPVTDTIGNYLVVLYVCGLLTQQIISPYTFLSEYQELEQGYVPKNQARIVMWELPKDFVVSFHSHIQGQVTMCGGFFWLKDNSTFIGIQREVFDSLYIKEC